MVSMQPVTQSYLEEPESCFKIVPKEYKSKSLMSTLMCCSPLFAYLAQISLLDTMLDSDEFTGSCFAPCEEYCKRYMHIFIDKTDHLTARKIVLASLLPNRITKDQLFKDYEILPTLDRYALMYIDSDKMLINHNLKIVRPNINCSNSTIHLLNGVISP